MKRKIIPGRKKRVWQCPVYIVYKLRLLLTPLAASRLLAALVWLKLKAWLATGQRNTPVWLSHTVGHIYSGHPINT